MSAIGAQLTREAAWRTAIDAGTVTAYIQDGKVTVKAPTGLEVPITVPEGTRRAPCSSRRSSASSTPVSGPATTRPPLLTPTITLVLPAGATG